MIPSVLLSITLANNRLPISHARMGRRLSFHLWIQRMHLPANLDRRFIINAFRNGYLVHPLNYWLSLSAGCGLALALTMPVKTCLATIPSMPIWPIPSAIRYCAWALQPRSTCRNGWNRDVIFTRLLFLRRSTLALVRSLGWMLQLEI